MTQNEILQKQQSTPPRAPNGYKAIRVCHGGTYFTWEFKKENE